MVPTSGKAEFSLTLQCDLECRGCSRASFLREAHTPSMELEDAEEFFRQADALDWKPSIIIIGGEPTMHRDFEKFVAMATDWSGTHVQVFSNGYSEKAKGRLKMVSQKYAASICGETHKPGGSVNGLEDFAGWTDDVYVSPADLGKPLRPPCFQHSSQLCGVSVDRYGYSPCSIGGSIDALLHVNGRTRVLADLFDEDRMRKMTAALCENCGFQGVTQGFFSAAEKDAQPKRFGAPMSPTWQLAFADRR